MSLGTEYMTKLQHADLEITQKSELFPPQSLQVSTTRNEH